MKNKALKNTRILTLLALTSAISVVLRLTINFIPNFQPMSIIIIFIGLIMGPVLGILNAALSVFLSNLILGSGLWTLSQIFSYSIIILIYSIINYFIKKSDFLNKYKYVIFLILSGLAGFLYGFVISISEVFLFNIPSFLTYYLAGIYFDSLHGIGNIVFFIILYPTLYKVIDENYKKIINS